MYLTTDDNGSTFVKHPLHNKQPGGVEVSISTTDVNRKSEEESTMDSSMTASQDDQQQQQQQQDNSGNNNSKPCHWVGYNDAETTVTTADLSMELEDDVSTLNASLDTSQAWINCEDSELFAPEEYDETVDVSCCEPGAIEVTVAWDSFQNMVTYVTPTIIPCMSECISTTRTATKSRRRRSSKKPRGRLLVNSHQSPVVMAWDIDFPLRSYGEEHSSSGVVRSADI